jgi:hypothetical protein
MRATARGRAKMQTKRYVYCVVDRGGDRQIEAVCLNRAEARAWIKIVGPTYPFQKFRVLRARLSLCE